MKKSLAVSLLIATGLAVSACNNTTSTPQPEKSTETSTQQAPAAAPVPSEEAPNEAVSDDVLVTINGEPITKNMYALYFQDRTKTMPGDTQSPEMQMNILNELANVVLIKQDAEAKKLPEREEIASALFLSRSTLLTQAAVQDHIQNNQPTDAELQALYQERFASKSEKEYKARHILLDDEEDAQGIISKLNEGGNFAKLAEDHSTGPSASSGGDLGWFDATSMVKPFSDAVAGLEKGKYSAQPVQTQYGWHVILLEDMRDAEPPTLGQVREVLMTELQQQVMTKYIKNLRDKAAIEFNEKIAKPKVEEAEPAPPESH